MAESRGVVLEHLRAWRTYKALTQSELADAAQVSRPTIGRLEAGGRANLPTVRVLANALHISVQQLYQAPPQG